MPQLDEIVNKRKKFKKTEYRAWDITGEWAKSKAENSEPSFDESDEDSLSEQSLNLNNDFNPSSNQNGIEIESKKDLKRIEIESINDVNSIEIDIYNPIEPKKIQDLDVNKIEIDSKKTTEQITKTDFKRIEIDSKKDLYIELNTIVGKERDMLFFLFSCCLKNRAEITRPLTLEFISESTGCKETSIKTTINRLIKKDLIYRENGKKGRSGWMRFRMPYWVYNEMLSQQKDFKWDLNRFQKDDKKDSKQVLEQITSPSSSSSYINNTTTTDSFNLNDDWLLIDISPLAEIGFSDAQLKQLAKAQKLTADQVQESIYAFAYARSKPEIASSIRTSHLAYFMGILIKRGEPYLPPYGYESPKEIALKAELERKKRQLALEEELAEIKFIEWYSSLNSEVKADLTKQQASDEDYKLYFESKQIPEHVKESKRKNILRPYFINIVCK